MTVVIGTANRHKLLEIRRILGDLAAGWLDLEDFPGWPEVPESGATFAENARLKAIAYSRFTGKPALADDSGLEVDGLDGGPGVHSARFAGPAQDARRNSEKLLETLADMPASARRGRFVCVVALADGETILAQAQGICAGTILPAARGAGGFGYDPVFLVPELGLTFAELSPSEKDRLSHRARALAGLRTALPSWQREARR